MDRYGVLTPEVARAAAIPGGLSQIYPALRALEDTGGLWRGQFVDGLGPLQYATPDFVEALRASAAEKPTRRADAHCVFADGAPVLYASVHLKSIYVYMSAEDDEQVDTAAPSAAATTSSDDALVTHAIQALLAAEKAAAQRQGLSWANQKIEVELVDEQPVLKTHWAQVLANIGFVRTPSGMRFYPDPF